MIRQSITKIESDSSSRPAHYLARVKSVSKIDGEFFVMTEKDYLGLVKEFSPHKLREIKKSLRTIRGLGDLIYWLLPHFIQRRFQSDCGCEDRRAWLNAKVPFGK